MGFRFLFCNNEDLLNRAKQHVSYAGKGLRLSAPQTGLELEAHSDAEHLATWVHVMCFFLEMQKYKIDACHANYCHVGVRHCTMSVVHL